MKTPEAIKEIQKEINRIELEKLGDGSYDCGGNRPFDYIEISEHEVAEKTLELKDKWSELTKNELAVLRSKFKENHINPDIVFQDKLRILRSLLYYIDMAERDALTSSKFPQQLLVNDEELEKLAIRFIQDSRFVEPSQKIVLTFAQAIETFKAGYRAAQKKPKSYIVATPTTVHAIKPELSFPSEGEIQSVASHVGLGLETVNERELAMESFMKGITWLKERWRVG